MIAFDTNVLLYVCDKDDQRKHERAVELLRDTRDGVILWQVAIEFVGAGRRFESRGFTRELAWARLKNFLATYPLIAPSPAALARAEQLHVDQRYSFWDALIVAACLDAGVTRLYSEDLPGRTPPDGLEIINPFA